MIKKQLAELTLEDLLKMPENALADCLVHLFDFRRSEDGKAYLSPVHRRMVQNLSLVRNGDVIRTIERGVVLRGKGKDYIRNLKNALEMEAEGKGRKPSRNGLDFSSLIATNRTRAIALILVLVEIRFPKEKNIQSIVSKMFRDSNRIRENFSIEELRRKGYSN